jgi:pimeloyl-ACP methyl ester carboxylesterase
MKCKTLLFALVLCTINYIEAQQNVKDFYYVEPETKNLPVFIRGNLEAKKILLFVQGGSADNGIDFGRSDYPKWKKTLETEVAIAYYDQRGLNRRVKKIDTSKINKTQVLKDIILVAKSLHKKYNADVFLFGHSNGGAKVLQCLATFPTETSFIQSGIAFNAPITTDFSPKRYNFYRPLYLKNIAREFIDQKIDTLYWQEAYDWMSTTDSISTLEDSKKWNAYVDKAYSPVKRKIGVGMVFRTVFARPYNPIKYLNNKDNKFIADKLWYAEKERWDNGQQTTLWELLPNVKHKVLLITGRFDPIAVPEEMEDAHKLLKSSELIIIPNATHESYLMQPEEFNRAVLSFLKEK